MDERIPRTARGRATRDRVVAAAAALMYEHGVAGTSLDDVRAATSTSKSQLYHYFADKAALVCAVVAHQQAQVVGGQQALLDDVSTMAGLRAWRDQVVRLNGAAATLGGCPIGGMVGETAADERSREATAAALDAWRGLIEDGLSRMRDAGDLPDDADPRALALGLLAALQGGLLLAQAHQTTEPLERALDHALLAVESLAASARPHPRA